MNSRSMISGAAVVAAFTLMSPVQGQEADGAAGDDHQAMMEAWEQAGTPGEQHAMLERMAGSWDLEVRMWMDPSAEPTTSSATAERRMVMDGRFLEEETSGSFMDAPFEGYALTGYNNVTGEFEATWIDNHSTIIFISRGELDPDGDGLVFRGTYSDPVTGSEKESRMVLRREGDDREVHEMFEPGPNGEEMKTMEIVYTRK